jgi:hypothetical protein
VTPRMTNPMTTAAATTMEIGIDAIVQLRE